MLMLTQTRVQPSATKMERQTQIGGTGKPREVEASGRPVQLAASAYF